MKALLLIFLCLCMTSFGQKDEKINLSFGVGLTFIPVLAREITPSYNSSTNIGSNTIASDPIYGEINRMQLRSNLMLESKLQIPFVTKEKWKFGGSLTIAGGIHLPWSEEFDADLRPAFSVGANIYFQRLNDAEVTYYAGYKYSVGGLEFYQPVLGVSFYKFDVFASTYRHRHYRQLSNGDLEVSKSIFEIGFRYYFFKLS